MNDPKTGSAPHDCPNCGAPSYVGGPGMPTQCTSRECPFYSEDCWVRWVMEIPDEEVGQEFDIEDDEPTVPDGGWLKMPTLKDQYANKGGPWRYNHTLDDVDTGAQVRDLFYPPKVLGILDALDAAIDKIPVPSWTKPLDKD